MKLKSLKKMKKITKKRNERQKKYIIECKDMNQETDLLTLWSKIMMSVAEKKNALIFFSFIKKQMKDELEQLESQENLDKYSFENAFRRFRLRKKIDMMEKVLESRDEESIYETIIFVSNEVFNNKIEKEIFYNAFNDGMKFVELSA